MRLCSRNTWPPRSISSVTPRRNRASLNGATTVWMAKRSLGGVSITDISRSPASDMFSVRGIGVAVRVSTSTLWLISLRRSLCATPKRCSSSTTSRPRSSKCTSFESSRCVPMRISTFPSSTAATTFFCSAALRKRLIISIFTGKAAMRRRNVSKCWKTKIVVGARTATCLESHTALKAARMATSVLPYPTSPHSRRSIGAERSMSRLMSAMAMIWSGVSVNSKASSNSRCQGVSAEKAKPGAALRSAYNSSSLSAMSVSDLRTRDLRVAQALPPKRSSAGLAPSTTR